MRAALWAVSLSTAARLSSALVRRCAPFDNDVCLQESNGWGRLYTCRWSSLAFCASWAKDMQRCCSLSCRTDYLTEDACDAVSASGSCVYPHDGGDCLTQASPTPAPTSTTTAAPATPAPTSTTVPIGQAEISALAWDHLVLLNQLRQDGFTCTDGTRYESNGVELQLDCRLWKASHLHSRDMADRDYFSHTTLGTGESPWDRAREQGINANGENIAAGSSTAEGVLEQWKNSPGHCNNMMSTNFKLVGVGYAEGGSFRHYWTQMFASISLDADEIDVSCYPSA